MADDERDQYAAQTWTIAGDVYTTKEAADVAEAENTVEVDPNG